MASFHFFQKEETTVHLDLNSPSYQAEKEQLLAQGFERGSGYIEAENTEQAYKKFAQEQKSSYSAWYSGRSNLLRFTRGIQSLINKRSK